LIHNADCLINEETLYMSHLHVPGRKLQQPAAEQERHDCQAARPALSDTPQEYPTVPPSISGHSGKVAQSPQRRPLPSHLFRLCSYLAIHTPNVRVTSRLR